MSKFFREFFIPSITCFLESPFMVGTTIEAKNILVVTTKWCLGTFRDLRATPSCLSAYPNPR